MATLRQQKLAKAIVESVENNKDVTAKQLLVSVGYKESTASRKPGEIIDQPGVKEMLVEYGFTLNAADDQVAAILTTAEKDENRLKAADLIYKRLGGYAPEKSVVVTATGDIKDFEKYKSLKDEYEARLLETLQDAKDISS